MRFSLEESPQSVRADDGFQLVLLRRRQRAFSAFVGERVVSGLGFRIGAQIDARAPVPPSSRAAMGEAIFQARWCRCPFSCLQTTIGLKILPSLFHLLLSFPRPGRFPTIPDYLIREIRIA